MSGKRVALLSTVTTVSVVIAIASVWFGTSMWFEIKSMQPPQMGPRPGSGTPLMVKAVVVTEKPLTEVEKYIARVEPIESVELEARIEGVIQKVHFLDGAVVKKGDLLYSIEKAQYDAQVVLKKANVSKAIATLNNDQKYLDRLRKADIRSVSQSDFDSAESSVAQSTAVLEEAKAYLRIARLNLSYTKIYSPINGRIGKNNFTEGNLVRPTSGVLGRIVQEDPVRVVFSATDRSYLKASKMLAEGYTDRLDIRVKLADDTFLDDAGTWSFIDNEMDSDTGTIAVRAQFSNANGYLTPGSYVKVFISPANAPKVAVVPQNAVMNDKDGYYVYVIGDENTIELRRIEVGSRVEMGFSVEMGLVAGEKIVVQGLQKAKPGMAVTVNLQRVN